MPSTALRDDSTEPPAPEQRMPSYRGGPQDERLLDLMRRYLAGAAIGRDTIETAYAESSFPQRYERLALIVYSPGLRRLLVVRPYQAAPSCLGDVLERVRRHKRYDEFDFADEDCRLQLELILEPPQPVDIRRIGMSQRGADHFEIGIDGLVFRHGGRSHYFFPGDAYVRSIMGMQQLREFLVRTRRLESFDDIPFQRFTSESYVSAGEHWLRLYRGHPLVGPLRRAKLEQAVRLALEHIRLQQHDDGRFLYYYDAAKDSRADHEHPERDPDRNPYYNMLRHGGGILTCIYYARLFGDRALHDNIRRGLEFMRSHARDYHDAHGREASYVYYNRKAKLGGSGLALLACVEYHRLTGDDRFDPWARHLCRHLLEQVTPSGEFIYYHVYLDQPVTEADNGRYFSFYYPGEALCGLAAYYNTLSASEERAEIADKVRRALHFLIVERPRLRAEHYTVLPSDSWLMMAVNELWDAPELRHDDYRDFVFGDADTMLRHMYHVHDAPYPDYAGAFFYRYGDYPYADGARCEGLLGAYELAHKVGDGARTARYEEALRRAAWATLHLVNTPDSVYSVPDPATALGGIRFKYTRQWFRIDTIQHVAGFYLKLMLHGKCPLP